MNNSFYDILTKKVTNNEALSQEDAVRVLDLGQLETLELLQVAYQFRRQYFGKMVTVHILNNVQNGMCPEDCRYCAQSASSSAPIEPYGMKSDEEILAEAAEAHDSGAMRYCMVFSGTGPSYERVDHLVRLIKQIKQRHKIEVCVSAGAVDRNQARQLKEAGLDRLNHNLNTSEKYYHHICTSHTYADRLQTLQAAHAEGLAVCSGVIIGMGENAQDLYEMTYNLRELGAESIPVNFLIPIPGIALKEARGLSPEYCLRVLCLFRLMNPKAEIRMAAGREIHLGSLEPLGLFAANSLFLQGYLNTRGAADVRTLTMIKDAGFTISSEIPMDKLLSRSSGPMLPEGLKSLDELRPFKVRE
ncbi:MAG: biotin synthase BioB [Candidatus Omnitrophica bacterium]|nr:biotin synthase BioB [Candidatus Omnitrophota bacterium]